MFNISGSGSFVFHEEIVPVASAGQYFVLACNEKRDSLLYSATDHSAPTVKKLLNPNHRVKSIKCSYSYAVILCFDGSVYVTGGNTFGDKLPVDGIALIPQSHFNDLRVSSIARGAYHTLFLTDTNELYAGGNNDMGGLMIENMGDRENPPQKCTKVVLNEGEKVVEIAAGYWFSLYRTSHGRVMGAGFNWDGQLGVTEREVAKPVQVPLPESERIIKIDCGYRHSIFLTAGGNVYACGYNSDGECGEAPQNYKPTIMHKFGERISDIICGGFQTILIGQTYGTYMFGAKCGIQTSTAYPSVNLVNSCQRAFPTKFNEFKEKQGQDKLKMNITSGGYNVIVYFSRSESDEIEKFYQRLLRVYKQESFVDVEFL